ncbi:hypothetical protein RYX36_018582 [Vicia faba]
MKSSNSAIDRHELCPVEDDSAAVLTDELTLTQQISFCNPADVEAFTEEKKQSLAKRQGKGADFVRAVKEIVDSYEKLKERQLGEANCGSNVADANISKPFNSYDKDQKVAPDSSPTLPMKSSNSAIDRHELCPVEDDSAAVLTDELTLTQQIAFCNPADVEAFTEEKKQSLAKRQGKGADFVRAVKEIVDSYEKLKERQLGEANCGSNVADANISKPFNSYDKDQKVAPDSSPTLPMKSSNSAIDRHELCPVEDDSAAVLTDECHDKEASKKELTDNVATPINQCNLDFLDADESKIQMQKMQIRIKK